MEKPRKEMWHYSGVFYTGLGVIVSLAVNEPDGSYPIIVVEMPFGHMIATVV